MRKGWAGGRDALRHEENCCPLPDGGMAPPNRTGWPDSRRSSRTYFLLLFARHSKGGRLETIFPKGETEEKAETLRRRQGQACARDGGSASLESVGASLGLPR